MSRVRLYPFLIGLLPALHLSAHNPGWVRQEDLAAVLLSLLVLTGAIYAALALLLRPWAPAGAVAVATAGAVAFLAIYRGLKTAIRAGAAEEAILLGGAALLAVGGLVVLRRWPAAIPPTERFLTLFGTLLVLWLSGRIGLHELQGRREIAGSRLLRELSGTPPPPAVRPGPRPDIYLIVLDEHANGEILRERVGFDNRAFEDSLRRIGFTVPPVVRSNYLHTMLSLPSMLNFAHLVPLVEEVGRDGRNPAIPDELVQRNRATRYLRAWGYRVFFLPSQWWPATRHLRLADVELDPWPGVGLSREVSRSDLRRKLRPMTVLGATRLGRQEHDADYVRRSLELLAQLPDSAGPKLVVAHLINPHAPYVFDRRCGIVSRMPTRKPAKLDAYVEQVQCIDRLMLNLARELIRRSPVPPIILVQGDHGTKTLGERHPGYVRERSGAFGAYYLPGGPELPDTVTLVNLFPLVFNHYFGVRLPLQPDSVYFSPMRSAYDLRPADERTLAGP